jgi:hypothetical protein
VIRAQTLEVQLTRSGGAMEVVFGVCELAVGDEPSKADAIANALAPAKEATAIQPRTETPIAADAPATEAPIPAAAEAPMGAAPAAAAAVHTSSESDWDLTDQPAAAEEKNGKRGMGDRAHRHTQPPPAS